MQVPISNLSSNELIYDFQSDLVPFAQFKKREKHTWMSVTFRLLACNFTKSNTPPWVFSRFLNCAMVPNCATHHICKTVNVKVVIIRDLQNMN